MHSNSAKRERSFIENMLSYSKAIIFENVHFSISLREMLKIPRTDAKKRFKNMPVASLLEPAVG